MAVNWDGGSDRPVNIRSIVLITIAHGFNKSILPRFNTQYQPGPSLPVPEKDV
jgi:hypothetical protein